MTRRLIISAIVLLLAFSVIIGFIIVRKQSASGGNPVKAIPVDASLIVKLNDIHSFSNSIIGENKIWEELEKLEVFHSMVNLITQVDSLTKKNSEFGKIALNSTVLISVHHIGGHKSAILNVIALPPGRGEHGMTDLFSKLTGKDIKKASRKYEGKTIYSISFGGKGHKPEYYLAITNGLMIISQSVILIENSIRQISLSKSLLDDNEFMKVNATAGKNKEANLYINLTRFGSIASAYGSEKFSNILKNYKNFGSWAEFDIHTTSNQIMLNGFLASENGSDLFLNIFKDGKPVKITSDKILPSTIAAFVSIGINNTESMLKGFEKYLAKIGKASQRRNYLKEVEQKFEVNLENEFLSIIDDEITIAQGFDDGSGHQPSIFVLIKCKSGTQASKQIKSMVEKIGLNKGINLAGLFSDVSIDSDTKYKIGELPLNNLPGVLFGGLFSIEGKTYYTFLGNYMIISQSKTALRSLLYSNVLNKTMTNNESFRSLNNNIVQKSHILFYTNLSRSSKLFEPYIDNEIIKAWEENMNIFQKVQPFGMQITEVGDMKYCNILVQLLEDLRGKPQTVWESLLDTAISFKPQLVENHYTKQKEIVVQDLENIIYLINKTGRILWKQKLTEKINSQVYQVDYYKNGKLQLLFSTENFIHLIDREGNYVERFPVRLRVNSSAGMSLFDYDSDKNYRIFIPCIDNKIYVFDLTGRMISGWEFKGSDYPVYHPIDHFRLGDKDYIILADKFHLFILDRKGLARIAIDESIERSKNNDFIFENNGSTEKSRIVLTDSTGSIISVYFNGSISRTSVGRFSENHYFDFKDVDADGENDFIFLDGNKLSIFRQNKSKVYSYEFRHSINEKPVYFRFSATDRKLGLVDKTDQRIYLINNNGALYKDFPLSGTTLFSIGNLDNTSGTFNLIVGGRNNFLYNYSVQ